MRTVGLERFGEEGSSFKVDGLATFGWAAGGHTSGDGTLAFVSSAALTDTSEGAVAALLVVTGPFSGSVSGLAVAVFVVMVAGAVVTGPSDSLLLTVGDGVSAVGTTTAAGAATGVVLVL